MSKLDEYIFLPPTKTGGVSITTLLRDLIYCPPHITIGELDYKNKKVFYCTRNPYTRVHSQYYFFRNKRKLIPKKVTFKDFIMGYDSFNKNKGPEKYAFKTITDLVSVDGEIKGYKYLRFEHLGDDFNKFCKEEFNMDLKLGHHNKNNEKKPFNMDVFDDEMLEEVNRLFHDDFVNFGYKKIERNEDKQK